MEVVYAEAGEYEREGRGHVKKDWESLPPLNRNVAGIDVGSAEHHVAVPMGRDAEPVQKFGISDGTHLLIYSRDSSKIL
jgi:hypothetical protein